MHTPPLSKRKFGAFAAVAGLLIAGACVQATAAPRAENQAADNTAFDALLSLPQGVPDESRFPLVGIENAPADENELRAVLAAQLKAGTDINAYRHHGTLLLHALRAGLDSTALWLLAQGADPRLEVTRPAAGGGLAEKTGDDALQVALMFRRWRVVDALLRRPDLKPVTDTDRAFRWSAVFHARESNGTPAQAVRELQRRGLPMPSGWQGDCLLARALDEGLVSLVLALPATTARAASGRFTGREAALAASCPDDAARASPRGGPSGGDRFSDFTPADLVRADARLAAPLLPALLPTLAGTQDLAALARLPLRRPVDDPAFVRSLVVHALNSQVSPAVTRAVLDTVPPARLSAALDDESVLSAWLTRFAGQPLESYAWALQRVDPGVLRRHVDTAIVATSRARAAAQSAVALLSAPAPAHWEALLARLPAPLGERADLQLTQIVPEAAWPALFARGYAPGAKELAEEMRARSTQVHFERRWPLLRGASAREAQTQAFAMLLQPWTRGCAYAWFAPTVEDVARVKWLSDAGLRPPEPAVLAVSCEDAMPRELLASLLATRAVVKAPLNALRFVLDRPDCEARPEPDVVRALAAGRFHHDVPGAPGGLLPAPAPEVVQAIAEPGRSRCAWLVSGGNVSARDFIDDESFYDGYVRLTPCLDPTLHGELWRVVDGRLQTESVGEGAVNGGLTLRETSTGRRYFLTWPVPGSTCDAGHPAVLLGWTGEPGAQHLSVLDDGHPAKAALLRQCNLSDAGPCFGVPSREADAEAEPGGAARPGKQRAWDVDWSVEDFIDHHAQAQREAFVAAFLALDTPRLNAMVAEGIPARWRGHALEALNQSVLPLQAKRQRTAWMFRDKAGLTASFGSSYTLSPAVLGLVAWLPREDWRPLTNVLAGKGDLLRQLRDAARAKRDARLACVFSRALNEPCEPGSP